MKKSIYILGAAGSIGMQTLDVVNKHPDLFEIVGLSLGSNDEKNHLILSQTTPKIVALRHKEQLRSYQKRYPNISFVYGVQGLIYVSKYPIEGLFLNALSGSAGLMPTVEAIKSGKPILLANKETLVMAGDQIRRLIKKYSGKLYPIDSEHSAIWQTLQGESLDHVKKIVITASGGALRNLSRNHLKDIKLVDALKHPNWSMGAKITIDSATMMNKGLEVIEAHHLFQLPYDKIETILHDESVCHGITYFNDGTIKASLSPSDMRIPIAYALFYPDKSPYDQELSLANLSFKPMDFERFPLLKLAYEVGQKGGLLPTVMNAANEAAVKLFIQGHITFLQIEEIVMTYVQKYQNQLRPSLQLIIQTDQQIQQEIFNMYEKR